MGNSRVPMTTENNEDTSKINPNISMLDTLLKKLLFFIIFFCEKYL